MKKILKFIIKYLGEILLVIGSFITAYNVFNFDHRQGGFFPNASAPPVYFYSNDSQFMIAIGVVLIVIGILIIRNKKK